MAFNINNQDFFSNERYGLRYRTDIQVLQYYVPAPDLWLDINGIGAQYLDDLLDVIITSPAGGQILRYDGANWVNYTLNSVITGGSVVDSTLHWDGADWIESTSFINDTGSQLVFFGDSTNVNYPIAASNVFAYFKNLQSLYIGDAAGGELDIANIFGYCLSIGNDNKTSNDYQYIFGNTNYCLNANSYNFVCGNTNIIDATTSFVFGNGNTSTGIASANDLDVIFGDNCTISSSTYSFIFGDTNSITDGTHNVIFGGPNHVINGAGGVTNNSVILTGDTNSILSTGAGTHDNNSIIAGNNNTLTNCNNTCIIAGEGISVVSESNIVVVSSLSIYGDTAGGNNNAEFKMRTTTANQAAGLATLISAGTSTVTIPNQTVTADSIFLLTAQDNNSTGALRVISRVNGTSFTVQSSIDSNNGVIAYLIINKI